MKKTALTAIAASAILAFSTVPAHALSSGSPFAQVLPAVPTAASASQADLSAVESEIIRLTNQHRAAHGVQPVQHDPTLSANSQEWSDHMAAHQDFRHSGKWNVAENIAATTEANPSAATIVDMWMNSDGHRANILNPDYNKIGVGLDVSADGTTYATQQLIW